MRREERRLAGGWTYEPPTFYEQNEAARDSAPATGPQAKLCRPVSCRAVPTPLAPSHGRDVGLPAGEPVATG
jgi:hypothetical protein